jgi:hypothetical protein
MLSFARLKPTSVRRWIGLPAAVGLVAAGALLAGAGPAHADDILPSRYPRARR